MDARFLKNFVKIVQMLREQQLHLSGDGVWAEMAQFVGRDEAAHEGRWRSMWAEMGLVVGGYGAACGWR